MLLCLAFAYQGSRGLWDPDEGRYTAVALQMLESGDFWTPRLNPNREHLTKPPLTYWALAASMSTLGRNELAARLPNALAFVMTGWLVWLLARQLGLRRTWLAPFIWGSSLVTVLAANVVTTDTLLASLQTLAVYLWWRMQQGDAAHAGRWRLALWLALAAAFMTKGPPGLLPLIPILVYRLWYRPKALQPPLIDAASLAVFALFGLGWFVSMVMLKPALLSYFLGHEFIDRVFSDTHGRNGQWYGAIKVYLPMALLALLPWGAYALAVRDRGAPGPWRRAFWRSRRDPQGVFLWLWLLLPLGVFAIAQSRLVLYVLPLAVPLSLLSARVIDRRWQGALSWRRALLAGAWLLAVLAIKATGSQFDNDKDARVLASRIGAAAAQRQLLLFLDLPARYGLRFYLDRPVEQVSSTPGGLIKAHGLRERSLCEALEITPSALVIARGAWLQPGAVAEPPPRCPGWRFLTPEPLSGVWLPLRNETSLAAPAQLSESRPQPTRASATPMLPIPAPER
jgi:4-amino-4-deoxy-L-arabinose transferase-like glycosyltransferase